jgi:hypothetical protein
MEMQVWEIRMIAEIRRLHAGGKRKKPASRDGWKAEFFKKSIIF